MDGMINREGFRTHADIARILTERGVPMTARSVWHAEHRAIEKLAAHPMMQELAAALGYSEPPRVLTKRQLSRKKRS